MTGRTPTPSIFPMVSTLRDSAHHGSPWHRSSWSCRRLLPSRTKSESSSKPPSPQISPNDLRMMLCYLIFLCLVLIIVASAIYSVCVCEPTCLPMIFLEEVHTWWLQTESQSNSHRLCIPTWKGEGRSAALNHLNSGEKIAPGGFSLLGGAVPVILYITIVTEGPYPNFRMSLPKYTPVTAIYNPNRTPMCESWICSPEPSRSRWVPLQWKRLDSIENPGCHSAGGIDSPT